MAETTLYKLTSEGLVAFWNMQIKQAQMVKQPFDQEALVAHKYYAQRHGFFYNDYNLDIGEYPFCATLNKMYEAIRVFEPELMFKAPKKRVYNHKSNPELHEFCQVLQQWENLLTDETNWKVECKQSIHEALLDGCGAQLTEYDSVNKLVTSSYFPISDVLVDPYARNFRTANWITLKFDVPIWEIARRFGKAAGEAAKNRYGGRSFTFTEPTGEKTEWQPAKPHHITYYVIYSKMGMGIRDKAFVDEKTKEEVRDIDHIKLVISPDIPEAVLSPPTHWETPFWMDYREQSWPVSFVFFARQPRRLWPMSHFKPALGVQEALDWLVTHILRHLSVTSKELIITNSSLPEEIKELLRSGRDLEVAELPDAYGKAVKDIIDVLQFKPMNSDIWRAVDLLIDLWERITGVSDILYGQTRHAYRSAEEARLKELHARATPEEMLDTVEDWLSEVVRKECICSRWHVDAKTIAMHLGQRAGEIWGEYQENDIERLVREIGYGVQVGSSKKPNPAKRQEDIGIIFEMLMPLYQQVGAVDRTNTAIRELLEAHNIERPERFELTPEDMAKEVSQNEPQQALPMGQAI